MKFSVSEMMQYNRCRRAWDLQSQNRKGLVPVHGAPAPLWIGSMFHGIVDAQARGVPLEQATKEYIVLKKTEYEDDYERAIGAKVSPEEVSRFYEIAGEAMELVESYFAHYGREHPMGEDFEYVVTEMTSEVPIPRTRNHLICTMDGIARELSTGKLWVVEHKSYAQRPNLDKLTTDFQLAAYLWVAEMMFTDDEFEGVIYDGVSKKPGAMERFTRHLVRMPRQLLLQTEQTIVALSREMANPSTQIFPNFVWTGCFDCQVRDVCKSMSFGEDVEWLLKAQYRKGEGHATVRRMGRPRAEVRSVADLERYRDRI